MEDKPLNELDFSDLTSADPELQQYIDKELQILKDSQDPPPEPRPVFELNWTNRVIVNGLPEVTEQSKAQSLIKFLSRICEKSKCPIDPSNIYMPLINGTSLRFAILVFPEEEIAKSAALNLNGVQLDKKHQLSVVSLEEFDRLMDMPDEYREPRIYSQQELKSWLIDNLGRDQFIIRAGDKTQVFWNDVLSKSAELVTSGPAGKVWTDKYVVWSTDGTYLATLHSRGVAIWAGPEFEEQSKLEHNGVVNALFSPCERFLLTYSPKGKFIVWDIASKEEMRVFPAEDDKWGTYKWNFNGDYIAKMADSSIFVYKTPEMSLIEDFTGQKRPFKVENLTDFSWSPSSNLIACYLKPSNNKSALIKVISIPSKETVVSRNLFESAACTFFWHNEGEYLLSVITTDVSITKYTRKSLLEITCFNSKQVATSTKEVLAEVVSCAWQASSNRFAIISVKDAHHKFNLFKIDPQQNIELVAEKETSMKELLWAPQGNQIVLYSKEKGKLMFFSVNEKSVIELEERNHSNMNFLEWDPSGRYLVVCKTVDLKVIGQQVGAGYTIYNGQGEVIYQCLMDKFHQFSWRRRPKFILPKDAHNKLLNEYEHLVKKYSEQDKDLKKKVKQEKARKEQEKKIEFMAILQKGRDIWAKSALEREQVTGKTEEEEGKLWVSKQVNYEEVVSSSREKVID